MGLLTSAAAVFVLCACGTALVLYVIHVQESKLEDTSYRALCDLDDTIACSEYLAADKGLQELIERLANRVGVTYTPSFNLHNPLARITFFPIVCLLGCLPFTPTRFLATLLTSISSMLSAYLLYHLVYVTNQICLPCLAIYFLHLLLFLVLTMRWAGTSTQQARPSATPSKQQARPSATPSKQKESEEKPKQKESSDEGSKKQKEKDSVDGKGSSPRKRKRKH